MQKRQPFWQEFESRLRAFDHYENDPDFLCVPCYKAGIFLKLCKEVLLTSEIGSKVSRVLGKTH